VEGKRRTGKKRKKEEQGKKGDPTICPQYSRDYPSLLRKDKGGEGKGKLIGEPSPTERRGDSLKKKTDPAVLVLVRTFKGQEGRRKRGKKKKKKKKRKGGWGGKEKKN